MSKAAPYFDDVARGPTGESCVWVHAEDGVRLRTVFWPLEGAKGSVLIFPGRTEYVEKYSDAARELNARGFASAAIDWRGQGLSDRASDDRRLGHVDQFNEYQSDVRAYVAAARAANLPEPYFLLGHSMGGCIGLRALHQGLAVRAAGFSAPMWGLELTPAVRAGGWVLSTLARSVGLGQRYAPTPAASAEPAAQPFEGNLLTTDAEMFAWMQDQIRLHPDLFLGGVSLGWLNAALRECLSLSRMAAPDMPTLCWLGSEEKIVDPDAIHVRMGSWAQGELIHVPGAEHEVLMERANMRATTFDEMAAFFDRFC